jgi:hypothetical protein
MQSNTAANADCGGYWTFARCWDLIERHHPSHEAGLHFRALVLGHVEEKFYIVIKGWLGRLCRVLA